MKILDGRGGPANPRSPGGYKSLKVMEGPGVLGRSCSVLKVVEVLAGPGGLGGHG